ncbi:MAG TPA: hypothetical protein VJR27_05315 [Candidatus Saccharimonadales bacterium]|nr:hypothetical protein [Candidatus Saccharimonadales bacterium]
MVSHEYPTIPSSNPHRDDSDLKDEDFPRPEDDKDIAYSHVDRLMGYAPKKKRIGLRVLLIVLGLAVLCAGGYFVATHVHFSDKKAPAKTTASETPKKETAAPKQYTSSHFGLSFTYPETWGVLDDGSGKLTVTSPALALKNGSNKTVQGRVVATIRNKQAALDEFKKGNAVAAIASEKLSYTKPTSNQRAQTYISFLNYASSTGNGIDGVYVTGDIGYQQGQAVPQSDVVQTDPLITVTFLQCGDSTCSSGGTPLTVSSDEWKNNDFKTPITTFIASLAIN